MLIRTYLMLARNRMLGRRSAVSTNV